METLTYSFSFPVVPPGFKRGRLTMIAAFKQDRLILSRKRVYPKDIYRLVGGGIEPDEDSLQGALREFKEETGADNVDLDHRSRFHFDLEETTTKKRYEYEVELFYATLTNQNLSPADDIDMLKPFSKAELNENITRMKQLTVEFGNPMNEHHSFRWTDWGILYSVVHEYVLKNWPEDS